MTMKQNEIRNKIAARNLAIDSIQAEIDRLNENLEEQQEGLKKMYVEAEKFKIATNLKNFHFGKGFYYVVQFKQQTSVNRQTLKELIDPRMLGKKYLIKVYNDGHTVFGHSGPPTLASEFLSAFEVYIESIQKIRQDIKVETYYSGQSKHKIIRIDDSIIFENHPLVVQKDMITDSHLANPDIIYPGWFADIDIGVVPMGTFERISGLLEKKCDWGEKY